MDISEYQFHVIQTVLLVIITLLIIFSSYKKTIDKLKLFFKRCYTIFFHWGSRLIPKTSNLVVFGGENGMGFRGNTKYLFLSMASDPNIRCVWIAKKQDVVREVNELGYEAYMHHSRTGVLLQLRAKLVIHSHAINDDFEKVLLGGAISYLTWHGVGLKKVWGANNKTYSYKVMHERNPLKRGFGKLVVKTNQCKVNYVVSTSEKVTSYYPETFIVPHKSILELGQVRNDIFFKETEEDEQIPKWYRERNVILYMPTHRNKGKLDKSIGEVIDFEKLNEFCREHKLIFVIKRHMYSKGIIPKHYENIIDITNEPYDPQFLLKYAELLVTDYSSCYTDYLLLNRPVVFFSYDLDLYLQASNEMYHDYFDVTPGPKVEEFNKLLNVIEESLQHPNKFEADRKRVLDIFYSKANQQPVLEKQVSYIYSHLLNLPKS